MGGGGGGGLLHMNINLDSTNIIITGHKIVPSFFLRRFLLSVTMSGQRSGFTNAYNRPCRLPQTNSYNSCSIDFFQHA